MRPNEAAVGHFRDLGAAAADIYDEAVHKRDFVEGTDGAVEGFQLTVEDAQGQPDVAFYLFDEGGSIVRVTDGTGGSGDDFIHTDAFAEVFEQLQGEEGTRVAAALSPVAVMPSRRRTTSRISSSRL